MKATRKDLIKALKENIEIREGLKAENAVLKEDVWRCVRFIHSAIFLMENGTDEQKAYARVAQEYIKDYKEE